MEPLTLDSETALIGPGRQAPDLSCVAFSGQGYRWIRHWTEFLDDLVRALTDTRFLIVGHTVAFDMSVFAAAEPGLFPLIFEAYRQNRVTDTEIRAKLLDIAAGCYRGFEEDPDSEEGERTVTKLKYGLEPLAERFLGRSLDKNTWRLRYGELRNLPLANWPPGAVEYPLEDVRATEDLFKVQEQAPGQFLADQFRQARAAFWIKLMTAWGIHTDQEGVSELARRTKQERDLIAADLQSGGLLWGPRPKGAKNWGKLGTRNTKAAKQRLVQAYSAMGQEYPRTEKGDVCLDERACKESGDQVLVKYGHFAGLCAILNKDVPALAGMSPEQKAEYKKGNYARFSFNRTPIHSQFESLLETGRTSSSGPNIQNPKRKGGIRECFVPRPGCVFAACDYSGAELATLGQTCVTLLGRSSLAEALNAGRDPHLMIASQILNRQYQDVEAVKDSGAGSDCQSSLGKCFCPFCIVDDARQTGKVANFGFPGGLGYSALVEFALAQYDVRLSPEQAKSLKRIWLLTWSEMKDYFRFIDWTVKSGQPIQQLFSGRFRGDLSYTARCNTMFQGLAADMAKDAGFRIAFACYADPSSPLFGCRIVNFVHDEFILEVPEERAHEAAIELSRLMKDAAHLWVPACPPKAKPLLMRRWSKKAKAVYVNGRLIPWEDSQNDNARKVVSPWAA